MTTGHILYVDDDAGNLTVLRALLADALPLLTAQSGDEALALLERHEVAVLLADQRMPGKTGVDVLVAAQQAAPDTTRVLTTAYSDIDEAVAAINHGRVQRYVRKPWEPTELKAMLVALREAWLSRRRMGAMQLRLQEAERVNALGVVAAEVAHELRTPLHAVRTDLELISLHLEGSASVERPAAVEAAQKSQRAIDSMGDIVSSMQMSTKPAAAEPVDMKQVVELSLRMLGGAVRQHGGLEVKLEDVPKVRCTATRLGQVVTNLLLNALQAAPRPGRGSTSLPVSLHLYGKDGAVRLEVSDRGAGIRPADVERIFSPFFTTKANGGTGLGLAIVKSIVEECGGSVGVESMPGEGSTFTVTFPAVD